VHTDIEDVHDMLVGDTRERARFAEQQPAFGRLGSYAAYTTPVLPAPTASSTV